MERSPSSSSPEPETNTPMISTHPSAALKSNELENNDMEVVRGGEVTDEEIDYDDENELGGIQIDSEELKRIMEENEKRRMKMEKKKAKKPTYFWLRVGMEAHHSLFAWFLVLGTVFMLALTWLIAILVPGLSLCTDESCPFVMPLWLQILILLFTCFVNIGLGFIAVGIIACPGVLLKQAFRIKAGAMICILLLFWSFWLTVFPIMHRGNVVPYYRHQRYIIDIQEIDDTTADVVVSNMYSEAINGKRLMLKVIRATGSEKSIWDLWPGADVIYEDKNGDELTNVNSASWTRSIKVDGLDSGEYYIFIFVPAHKNSGGSVREAFDPLVHENEITVFNGDPVSNAYLDLRAYRICMWTPGSSSNLGVSCRHYIH